MKAKKKPLNELTLAAVLAASGKQAAATTRLVGYELPPEKQPGRIFKGKPAAEMVKEVVGLLRSEAKII
jgi:electron transfer flavoprotein beta subunit